MKKIIGINLVVLASLVIVCFAENKPNPFRLNDYYPRKGISNPRASEAKSSGAIRDVIKRNSPRFRKVLVRNANNDIVFANEDCRYMTSRAKSKLDILGSLVQSYLGDKLYVQKTWTDVVNKNDLLSLHYEGRAFEVRLVGGSKRLSNLLDQALRAGFDWVHYENSNYVHISVVPDVCQTKLDLAVVVDTSGSVQYHNFQKVQRFLKDLVDFFNIGADETHIALVSYSYTVKKEFGLTQYYSKSQLKSAIDKMWYQGSNTRTGDALMSLKDDIFAPGRGVRSDKSIPKIGILMTDGYSNGGTSVSYGAKQVKQLGINMFVIGVTSSPRQSEINDIASSPIAEHYFKIDAFNDLSSFVDQISSTSCDEGAQISTCENADTTVDGGSFKYFRVQLKPEVSRVSVEVNDIKGRSFLYTSVTQKNPGPLSKGDVQKSEQLASPRTISVPLQAGVKKILYIAVQGQEDVNEFALSIWDSLFPKDRDSVSVTENQGPVVVTRVQTRLTPNSFDYSIKAGGRGYFTIDKSTGRISTTKALDRENIPSYQLSIVAHDRTENCHKGLMVLDVNVGDENDNKPVFGRTYSATVSEDVPSNQYVVQVKATDRDTGSNAELVYQISGDVFRIDQRTGIVYTSKPLDHETKSTYTLTLTVRDSGSPQRSDSTTLKITVTDVNEPPMFSSPSCLRTKSCQYNVDEEGNAGKRVQTIKATDPDKNQACTLKYYIVSLDKQYFSIGETSGILTTKVPLNREVKEYYSLDIEVRDCGRPKLFARTTIKVQANDINDNAPRFRDQSPLQLSVAENFGLNQNMHTFVATDADKGKNAEIVFSISNNKGNNQFAINSNNGQLTLVKTLDRETKASHEIIVTATDKGATPMSSSIVVRIKVRDINDNPPILKAASGKVYENVQPRTPVMKVEATDRDEGFNAEIQYSIIGGNNGNMFRIDGNNGQITTNNIPDRETRDQYNLKIRAQDFGQPFIRSERMYTIQILDKNDNNPIFGQYSYTKTIPENTQVNTKVTQVSSTDRDIGVNAQRTYTLESGHNNDFAVNKDNGAINLVKSLDFGKKNFYRFRVKVTDKGTPSLSGFATVTITVIDSNDFNPKFTKNSYTASVNENVKLNTKVTEVKATDQDSGPSGVIVYSITKQDQENHFYIDSNSGVIYTRGPIDYERKQSYTITVQAADSGKPSRKTTSTVKVNVNDLNDNTPTFDNSPIKVMENHGTAVLIKQLKGEDKDSGSNAEFFYTLETKNTPFLISKGGAITINSALDRESVDLYLLNVRITDKGTNPSVRSSVRTIRVDILDYNDNKPQFSKNPFTCSVPEEAASNTHVCYTTATDRDIGENARITYSISGNANFKINPTNGEIQTTNSLDRETTAKYTLTVTATDNGSPIKSSSATVTISVTDVNDNEPKFEKSSYAVNFDEEQDDRTEVMKLAATDKDIGKNAELTFSIIKGAVFGSQTMFTIAKENDKAVLRANSLDREVRDKYVLTIRVEDRGSPRLSSEATVIVNVKDINDNNPILTKDTYTGSVKESVGKNTLVVKIEATDRDIGFNGEVVYTITGGTNQDHFVLDPKTGELKTNKKLDYEQIIQYTFDVQAEDKGTPQKLKDTAKVVIDIENVDDNAPEFEKVKLLEIAEDLGVGQPIVKFKAQDQDGSKIKYMITAGNEEDKFLLDENTALLSVKNSLDRETTDKYNLTVSAKDSSNTVYQYVPIKILDVNDNNPVFEKKEYPVSVTEDAGKFLYANSVLEKVKATDKDLGINKEIEYSIASGNVGDKFQISKDNGEIRAKGKLDREQVGCYNLIVVAKDKGSPSLASSVPVKITVADLNDNSPQFEQSSYTVTVAESLTSNSKIQDIRATDIDDADNGRVGYRIKSGDTSVFSIDATSGELKTIKGLDRETTPSYKLTIEAYDHGKSPLTNTADVTITILDINDNIPAFNPIQIKPVNESVNVGFNVGQITATDKDDGVNAELEYGLLEDGNDDFFSINANDGTITLKRKLDRERKDRHNVTLAVKDKGSPVLSKTLNYEIQVLDDNDNAPVFDKDSYAGALDEENPSAVSLFTVTATDDDVGDNAAITYSLEDDKNGVFRINAKSGLIEAIKPIDYETVQSYDLVVKAGDWKYETTVNPKVTIRNINDNAPVFNPSSYKKTIDENTGQGKSILQVTATDKDPFGDLVYSIKSGDSQPFAINSRTGEITSVGELDREVKDYYKFTVSVSDNGKPTKTADANVEIILSDVNDNKPTFTSYIYTVNVTENQDLGATVLKVTATDKDIGKNAEIRYRVKTGADLSEFSIGNTDGVIKTKKIFDRESQTETRFIIQAFDLGSPTPLVSDDVVIIIKILDENDNTPEWTEKDSNISIKEHVDKGTQIKTVVATDPDEGENGKISYSIKEKNVPFSIDFNTGLITVSGNIDRESKDNYRIILTATDNGKTKRSSSTTLSITVLDINDNAPKIRSIKGDIFENSPANTVIMTIKADDKDIGINAELTYELENHLDLFSLNLNTGELIARKPLDREEKDLYTLEVVVSDKGTPRQQGRGSVNVTIKDVDDNCPVFERSEYYARLEENAPFGTYVVTVKATDKDDGTNAYLDYGVLGGNDKGAFTVDSESGNVTVAGTVNKEDIDDVYFIMIRAGAKDCGVQLNDSDVGEGGKPQARNFTFATVYIEVNDVNDNAPVFLNGKEKIKYTQVSTKDIIQLNATDKDEGAGGLVKYKMLGQVQKLSSANEIEHHVTVGAYDQGLTPLSSNQKLVIVNKFRCDAMKFSIDESTGQVTVQSLCSVTNQNAGKKIGLLNTNITLTCKSESNVGKVTYQWYKDGVVVLDDDTKGVLVLTKITHEQQGSYSCIARNAAGSISSESTVIETHEIPSIIKAPQSITVGQQEEFKLEVRARGKPELKYQWYKDDKKYDTAKSNVFEISNAIKEDSADYHCVVSNIAGEVKTEKVTVKVFDKTTVVKVKVKVSNYDSKRDCHNFFPEDFEKVATGALPEDKVLVTKVESTSNITICNRTACSKNPCLNDGECNLLDNGGYQCTCKAAWTGKNCENDVNECDLSAICTNSGTCNNLNGSFSCECQSGLTGRRCEYKKDVCKNSTCTDEQNCVPTEQDSFSCIDKKSEVTLVIDSKKLLDWTQNKKYTLEHFLNQILRNSRPSNPPSRRRRRRSTSVDIGDSTINKKKNQIVNSTKVEVKLALDCKNTENSTVDFKKMCDIMLKGSLQSTSIEQCGVDNEVVKPDKPTSPPATADVNIVVEKPDGKALDAKETTDLLKSKDFTEKMSKEGTIEIEGVQTAYPEKSSSEEGGSNTVYIVAAIGAVVVVAVVIAALVMRRRRGKETVTHSHLMQQRSAMTRGGVSSTELVMGTKENMAYDANDELNTDGTFMFEMPRDLKSSNSPGTNINKEKLLDIGYYHGNMSSQRAENLLSACNESGTFLLYTNPEQALTFAVRAPEAGPKVRHFSLKKSGGKYTVKPGLSSEETFETINMVMEHYGVHAISFSESEPDVILKEPLLKSAL